MHVCMHFIIMPRAFCIDYRVVYNMCMPLSSAARCRTANAAGIGFFSISAAFNGTSTPSKPAAQVSGTYCKPALKNLVNHVEHFGPLWTHSALEFESTNRKLISMVHGRTQVEKQVGPSVT